MRRRLPPIRAAAALAAAATAVDLVLYLASAVLLRHGPSAPGYDVLLAANRLASAVAVGAAASQVGLAALGRARTRPATALLALLAAATAVPVGALLLLSTLLLALGANARLDAESVVLAMRGTGVDLTTAPVAFAAAAVALPLAAAIRRGFGGAAARTALGAVR